MKKEKKSGTIIKRTARTLLCLVAIVVITGSMTACAARSDSAVPQQEPAASEETTRDMGTTEGMQSDAVQQVDAQPEITQADRAQSEATQTDSTQSDGTQQTDGQQNDIQSAAMPDDAQKAEQPGDTQQAATQQGQNDNGQISLDEAKQSALADAGVSASDVTYTKEKQDYEDGIAVYDITFYVDNMEYEYEINAATGEVYSKSVEAHRMQAGRGQGAAAGNGNADAYISADSAEAIALAHAGFTGAEVSVLKSKFDIDDGQAEYEVEFYKDGREYEYKINAVDGSIMEYEVD